MMRPQLMFKVDPLPESPNLQLEHPDVLPERKETTAVVRTPLYSDITIWRLKQFTLEYQLSFLNVATHLIVSTFDIKS
jgi:hypothetical protein